MKERRVEKYPARFVQSTLDAYRQLKENDDYVKQWDALEVFRRKAYKQEGSKWKMLHYMAVKDFCKKWEIQYPLSPHLHISEKDLEKSVRPGSNVAKFLYALGLDGSASPERVKKVRKVSRKMEKRDTATMKVFFHLLTRKLKVSDRTVARIFDVDNKTVKKWADEVESWDPNEKDVIVKELELGRRFRNKTRSDGDEDREYKTTLKGKPVIKLKPRMDEIPIGNSEVIQTKEGLFKLQSPRSETL